MSNVERLERELAAAKLAEAKATLHPLLAYLFEHVDFLQVDECDGWSIEDLALSLIEGNPNAFGLNATCEHEDDRAGTQLVEDLTVCVEDGKLWFEGDEVADETEDKDVVLAKFHEALSMTPY